jgi:hypothetical protein
MKHKNWIVAGISGLALLCVLAAGALAQGTTPPQRGRALLRALHLSREQKEQALGIARGPRQEIRARVHGLLDSLTPEQRARLAGRDQARIERRLAFLLSRPRAAARIQRNLDR